MSTQQVIAGRVFPFLLLVAALSLNGCGAYRSLGDGLFAILHTEGGEIVIRLEPERAPMTTANFVGLAEGLIASSRGESVRYYDGLTFHRVEPGFVIQGGDPSGNGTGGPGYRFPNEIHPELVHDRPGVVAMANSGPHTNGSQFYITFAPAPQLDGGYSIFGEVVSGMGVAEQIARGDVIERVQIVRNGSAARAFDASAEAFDERVAAAKELIERERDALREAALAVIAERYPDARRLDSGIYIDGAATAQNDGSVTFHYTASVLDGAQFDDTRGRNDPLTVELGSENLLPGLAAVLEVIPAGARALTILPPELAFGEAGVRGVIPPWSYLVFDIEVLAAE